ncbi:MAG TPA: CDP-diacylglycerol--serine O-phosphatidyltransferase [Planctomycetota bacterium]|nr:CDP-diacylglycerol--serine O-phosphatidyltransferase [Planctomycetota bacterium]
MRKISILPSVITLGNLTCGFASIVLAAEGESDPEKFALAAWMILLAMVFDALDGQVARLTKTAGDFGVQLDSLCDAVTFGLAPAVLINRIGIYYGRPAMAESFAWLFPIVYVACAILRLARFNLETGIEDEDHEAFRGLPSPAAAGQVATLVILDEWLGGRHPLVGIMPFVGLAAGLLMVSRVPYVHMGNRLFKGQRPYTHLVTLIVLCIFMALSYKLALACLFTSYVVIGLLMGAFQYHRRHTEQPTTA